MKLINFLTTEYKQDAEFRKGVQHLKRLVISFSFIAFLLFLFCNWLLYLSGK